MPLAPQSEQHQDRSVNRFPDSRFRSGSEAPRFAEELPRALKRESTLDLRSRCPICGKAYQDGDEALALAQLSLAINTEPATLTAVGCDPSRKIILGHYGCVLPRLLTLLAGFQPELRFVEAANQLSACQSVLPERQP